MYKKAKIATNAAWNTAGLATSMVTGFVVAPFLVHRLGETNYGLWILIASFTSYFGLLDLGVRGSIGRQVAYRSAKGDRSGINAVVSLALFFLCAAGLLAMLGMFGVSLVFTRLFDVPSAEVGAARTALLLVGLNLALWLPLNIFDATLWAFERFDLINVIDIAGTLVRTALTFALIGNGGGLVALAWINLICMAGGQLAKAVATLRIDPGLRIGPGQLRPGEARELFGYSVWYSLMGIARTITRQVGPLLVGAWMTVQLVTPFTIANRLISYAVEVIVACAGVMTPIATALHARESHDRQRELFAEGGKFCLALSLFFTAVFLFLGRSLIEVWMGPELAFASRLLAILALGEVLPMSQSVTNSVILGIGGHRVLSWIYIAEGLGSAALSWPLAGAYGLAGICVAFAVMATLCRGLLQLLLGCRLVGMSPWQYVWAAILPSLAAASLPAAALMVVASWAPPRSFPQFVGFTAGYALGHFGAGSLLLVGPRRLALLRDALARKLSALWVPGK